MTTPSSAKGPARQGSPRPAWISVASRQTPSSTPGEPLKRRRKLPLIISAAVVLLGGGVLLLVLLSRGGDDAFEGYTRARALLDKGQDVEAMAEVRALETHTNDPRVRRLLSQLKAEIELAPKLRILAQLIESRSFAVAERQIAEVLLHHPQSAQVRLLQTSLRAAIAATPKVPPTRPTAAPSAARPVAPRDEAAVRRARPPAPARPRYRHGRPALGTRVERIIVEDPDRASAHEGQPHDQPREPGTDRVRVEASEPCRIFVDGVDTGRQTPSVLSLPLGTHVIAARSLKDGIARQEQTVTVKAGGNATLSFRLRAKPVRPIDSKNPYSGRQ